MAGNIHPVALTPKPDLNASLLIVVSRNPEPERLTEMLLRTILWLYFVMLALSLLTDPSVIAAPF
jgi:DNA-binding transcriptional regulator PaaX